MGFSPQWVPVLFSPVLFKDSAGSLVLVRTRRVNNDPHSLIDYVLAQHGAQHGAQHDHLSAAAGGLFAVGGFFIYLKYIYFINKKIDFV